MKSPRQLAIAVAAVVLVTAVVIAAFVPVKPTVIVLLGWIRGAGVLGVILYALAYVATAMCFVPPLLLNIAAGFLWGPAAGLAVVWPANVVAAMTTFGVGRWLGRDSVAQRLEHSRHLAALDRAVHAAGLKFVLLLKLSPICPFASMNYVLGTTRLRPRDFLVASLLGTLPGTLLYVSLGSLLSGSSEIFARHPARTGWHAHLLAIGGSFMAAAVAVLVRAARQELRRASTGLGND